jgi:hypothetical protein
MKITVITKLSAKGNVYIQTCHKPYSSSPKLYAKFETVNFKIIPALECPVTGTLLPAS